MAHLYGFKCGKAMCTIAGKDYFLVKIGVAEDNGFPQVLSRLNQISSRVENNLGIVIDVPSITNAVNSEGSPARGRTKAGSFQNLVSLTNVSDLQAHMNCNVSVFSHFRTEQTSKYDDLAFILPFPEITDIAEIEAVESHVCNQLGSRVHSQLFKQAVLASRVNYTNTTPAEINYTEFLLCSTDVFDTIQAGFITDNFYDVSTLLDLLKSSTLPLNVSEPLVQTDLTWRDTNQHDRSISVTVRLPVTRTINFGNH